LFRWLCAALIFVPAAFADNANVYPSTVPTVDVTSQYRLLRLYPQRKFDCPVALAIAPGPIRREMLMLQRGEVWQLPPNRLSGDAELFLDFREKLKSAMLFEEGFHGLAFHPDFAKNGKFYISYSSANPRRTVISEMRAHKGARAWKADPSTERVLLEQPHPMANHFAGGITFGPDGMLYIAIGDGGIRDDPYHNAQNPLMLQGKMLRINVNTRSGALPYGIPADNPFASKQEYRGEIWALGLRNPWGFSFDPVTQDLWLADVGQDLWEEINLVRKGGNYGWSDRDGPTQSLFHPQPFLPNLIYTEPVFAYTHAEGVCVVGGYVYRGTRLGRLHDCFLYGDWGHGWLQAVQIEGDSKTVRQRFILARKRPDGPPFNPTMIAAGVNGEPVIMSQEGAIYTLINADGGVDG
jgi:quinoprotein glucose dehydrogenase